MKAFFNKATGIVSGNSIGSSGRGEKYVKLEDLINRRSNLTMREREAIIEFVKTGDQKNKNKKNYIT